MGSRAWFPVHGFPRYMRFHMDLGRVEAGSCIISGKAFAHFGRHLMPHARITDETRRRWKAAQLSRTASPHLARVVERNIETLCEIREQMEQSRRIHDRLA